MTTEAIIAEPGPPSTRSGRKDILARLKLETAREHEAIEAATRLMHPLLSLGEYRAYLEISYAFYAAAEPLLARFAVWEALQLSAADRAKLPLLVGDLNELGCDPSKIATRATLSLTNLARAVGCAYVLEGSTLGGRVISRHVQHCLGARVPRSFLDCYGAYTGARWQAFRASVLLFAKTREVEDQIVAGAKETFRTFTRLLER
jgi:heme oxygenase (biliverdin-IX-beta and delta-forming)